MGLRVLKNTMECTSHHTFRRSNLVHTYGYQGVQRFAVNKMISNYQMFTFYPHTVFMPWLCFSGRYKRICKFAPSQL
jgi:hypothetical protein